MSLLLVELTRMRWRRAVLLLVIAVVALTAAIVAIYVYDTRPRDPGDFPTVLDLESVLRDTAVGVAGLLTAVGMLIGTTFVGHDWTSGSMSNQLLFEPRRQRVWWTKAGVVLLVTVVMTAAVLAGFWAVLVLVAQHRDLAAPGIGDRILHQTLRLSLFAGMCSVATYALTMAFRSTVATLGFLFACVVAVPVLLAAAGADPAIQPQNHFLAIAQDGTTIIDYDEPDCYDAIVYDDRTGEPSTQESRCVTHLDQHDGWLFLSTFAGLVVAGSAVSFGRRDVG